MSTIKFFRSQLSESDFDRKLIFTTGDHEIGSGFHVTELKLADTRSIDCGANQSSWTESTIQLLDGHGGTHMTVRKFAGIVDQSVRAMPGLADAKLRIEYAPGNVGKHIHHIGAVERADDAVHVTLQNDQALCKPATSSAAVCSVQKACC